MYTKEIQDGLFTNLLDSILLKVRMISLLWCDLILVYRMWKFSELNSTNRVHGKENLKVLVKNIWIGIN